MCFQGMSAPPGRIGPRAPGRLETLATGSAKSGSEKGTEPIAFAEIACALERHPIPERPAASLQRSATR
jgi:hypothetical protein